jgi:DNA-binding ferritin-like protein
MMSLQDYKNAKDVKHLVAKLFEARQVAHNVHLQTKSYSVHKALNKFYDELLDFVDSFVETYQGQYGILTGYEKLIVVEPVSDIETYIEDCAKIFNVAKEGLKDSHLKNIMEEIIALTYSTLYKLKNLK